MTKTGIFGGSFNPIHNGHISLARELREKTGLDEVWLMVSPQNPLKQSSDLLDDEARLAMARAAVASEPGIRVSDYEMHLPRPSYTWNTLQALQQDYPDREFVLLIGGDNWEVFDRWYRADDIQRNYQIVVYPRYVARGQARSLVNEPPAVPVPLKHEPLFVQAELIDISSTEIRQRIREGKSICRLVPPAVAEIIKHNGYYV